MEPARFDYSEGVIRRKLWINSTLAVIGFVYAALSGPTWSVFDAAVLIVIALSVYRLYDSALILHKRMPAIMVSDDGLYDAHLGGTLIPWGAIREIRAIAIGNRMGTGLLLMVDAAQLRRIPGPLTSQIANIAVGAWPGRAGRQMILLMTPAIALNASLGDILDQIRARRLAARIPIRGNG